MSKVKIIFDTNSAFALQSNNLDFLRRIVSKYFLDLVKKLIQHKVKKEYYFAITEVFKKEGLQKLKKKTLDYFSNLEQAKKVFDSVYPEIKIQSDLKQKDLEDRMENLLDKGLLQNNIDIIPIADTYTHGDILERALNSLPPFRVIDPSKGTDKGYKDTIAWVSIIQSASEDKECDRYILFSSDSDFLKNAEILEKEFKEKTQKVIVIGKPENMVTVIDGVFDLNLDSEAILVEVEQKIKEDFSIQEIFKTYSLNSLHSSNSKFWFPKEEWKKEVVQVLMENIIEISINDLTSKEVKLNVTLSFKPIFISNNSQNQNNSRPNKFPVLAGGEYFPVHGHSIVTTNFGPQNIWLNYNSETIYHPETIHQNFQIAYQRDIKNIKILGSEEAKPAAGLLWQI